MRSIDLHGKHVHQVEPILQQEIFQAMKQEAEALEIVHGWKDGDSLLKEVARVMQQMLSLIHI